MADQPKQNKRSESGFILARGTDKEQLRYGENPHQEEAYLYKNETYGIAHADVLQGKALSYNNLVDANAAWNSLRDINRLGEDSTDGANDPACVPACVVVKHTQPCGVALGRTTKEACERAFAADRESSFGGIVAMNQEIDGESADFLKGHFLEIVMAPSVSDEARHILSAKTNLRVLSYPLSDGSNRGIDMQQNKQDQTGETTSMADSIKILKTIGGGFLQQQQDDYLPSAEDLKWVTEKTLAAGMAEGQNDEVSKDEGRLPNDKSNSNLDDRPTGAKNGRDDIDSVAGEKITDLLFAWAVAKHCISNAIVIAKDGQTLGIGAGQTSRVFSVEIALLRAKKNGFGLAELKDAVVASDAFFPFADSLEILAEAGIGAVIQPGGSMRDKEVIAAADKLGMAMAFTGKRCFFHG